MIHRKVTASAFALAALAVAGCKPTEPRVPGDDPMPASVVVRKPPPIAEGGAAR